MLNKKTATLAMFAGLTLGGLSVASIASAQGYDGETSTDAQASTEGDIVQIQDDGSTDADAEGQTDDEGRRGRRSGRRLAVAAEAIGVDASTLQDALAEGESIADVAEANGVDADEVIEAMLDAKAERLSTKVEDGRITQDEADEKLAAFETKITDRVNGVDEELDA